MRRPRSRIALPAGLYAAVWVAVFTWDWLASPDASEAPILIACAVPAVLAGIAAADGVALLAILALAVVVTGALVALPSDDSGVHDAYTGGDAVLAEAALPVISLVRWRWAGWSGSWHAGCADVVRGRRG